jgi:ribosomal protein S18 acetylase RimI-like enzyme
VINACGYGHTLAGGRDERWRDPDLGPIDELAAERVLDAELGGRHQARRGEMNDVLALPGLGAWENDRLIGLATHALGGNRAELTALAVTRERRRRGIGGCLVEAVASLAAGAGADELWLVTANDNLDALRLYQRHGFTSPSCTPVRSTVPVN